MARNPIATIGAASSRVMYCHASSRSLEGGGFQPVRPPPKLGEPMVRNEMNRVARLTGPAARVGSFRMSHFMVRYNFSCRKVATGMPGCPLTDH